MHVWPGTAEQKQTIKELRSSSKRLLAICPFKIHILDCYCLFKVRAVARTLIGGGGGWGGAYSYIHVMPDRFLFKLRNFNLI